MVNFSFEPLWLYCHIIVLQSDTEDVGQLQWEQDKPLSERLKLPRLEPFDPLPPQLLRKVGTI